jgi:hypothetical protein
MNRHMASRGFGHGKLGCASVGRGRGHKDFPLPEARPPGITFNGVNRTRPTRCPQATVPAPGIIRSIFLSY